ncbi:glycoside hydrolase family 125 protein [Paenibacillus qinlingensis]|uniref:glycoside hydrolase family 125 protein n=1 Tax=Paenibacillus qinlingensis TaxID=1837343 RepID=UPI001567354B|nr:glycoside hydrolase family 125 protein [Paenibacillus qinlingensis]
MLRNVPSLFSIPYLDYTKPTDPTYQRTRSFILSKENPHFYTGKVAESIGSPHTPGQMPCLVSLCWMLWSFHYENSPAIRLGYAGVTPFNIKIEALIVSYKREEES